MVLLPKKMLNTLKVLVSKALIDLYVIYDEFLLINNALKQYDDMKEKIKNANNIKRIFIVLMFKARKTKC